MGPETAAWDPAARPWYRCGGIGSGPRQVAATPQPYVILVELLTAVPVGPIRFDYGLRGSLFMAAAMSFAEVRTLRTVPAAFRPSSGS